MATKKPIIFLSSRCHYSRTVMKTLEKHGLQDIFSYSVIDSNPHQIPKFVQSVPTVLMPDRRILTDEDVWTFIMQAVQVQKHTRASAESMRGLEPVKAFSRDCMGSTFATLEGLPCNDSDASGLCDLSHLNDHQRSSITGVMSADPSKPLSEDQIMTARGGGRGYADSHVSDAAVETLKRQRDDALSNRGEFDDKTIMGGSMLGAV